MTKEDPQKTASPDWPRPPGQGGGAYLLRGVDDSGVVPELQGANHSGGEGEQEVPRHLALLEEEGGGEEEGRGAGR